MSSVLSAIPGTMVTRVAHQITTLLSSGSFRTRFGLALAFAIVLHLPATPIVLFISFLSTLFDLKNADRYDYDAGGATTISVELAEPPKPVPALPDKVKGVVMETSPEQTQEQVKLPKGEDRAVEAKADPEKPHPGEGAEAKDKEKEKNKTPEALGLAGEMSRAVQGKTNVTLTLWFSTLRDHPLGAAMRPVVSCGILGAALQRAGIDPFQDLEGAMFAGQQISDPTRFTVAVHHRMSKDKLRDAIDRLARYKGGWIDETAARFHAGRANRVIFPHGNNMLFVTPETGWQQIRAIRSPLGIQTSRGRILSFSLLKPSIPFRKVGVRLPESLTEMRLDIFLSVTGSSEVQIRFEDRDELSASRNAPEVNRRIRDFLWQVQRVQELSGMISSSPLAAASDIQIPTVSLVADERAIVGQAQLNEAQSTAILSKLSTLMCPKGKPPTAGSAASSSSGSPPSTSLPVPAPATALPSSSVQR